ncbi:MAG TPA: YbaK/EbsC family protein [Candidatus Nanoarchaeia archaeon]|nr:YbaK/EbsC family protein [Candidatus Nanoarchaeia archaeon]
MAEQQTKQIIEFLDKSKIKYKLIVHRVVYTSEEAAKERGMPLKMGVKSLIFKLDKDEFKLILVRADRKADSKRLREILHVKNIRLASPEEVLKISGCEIGSVHPFGFLMKLEILMDKSILENEDVDFNIGQHTHSALMKAKDLVKILKPRIEEFTI